MKKKALALLITGIFVVSLGLTGCGNSPKALDKVKIGWIGSLSGDQAVWGICESNTVKMVIDDLNKTGGLLGKQVELVAYDTRGDATEAVNAVKRLTGQDKVIGNSFN